MQNPQTATLFFFAPVAAAYLAACAGWLMVDRLRPARQVEPPLPSSDRPVLDFLLALAAAAGILLLGAVYRQGWLLPTDGSWLGRLFWSLDNLIIFSPIAAVLVARRQGPETIFLSSVSPARLAEKIALGIALGIVAVSIYLALRGQVAELPEIVVASVAPDKMSNFLPVFLEGVALAFGFVRFRWLVGTAAALVVPCMLFAAAHIPGQLADDRGLLHIAAFFVFNTALATAILWTVQRSRDVIWIGMAHYLMDIAIRAI